MSDRDSGGSASAPAWTTDPTVQQARATLMATLSAIGHAVETLHDPVMEAITGNAMQTALDALCEAVAALALP